MTGGNQHREPTPFPSRPLDLFEAQELQDWEAAAARARRAPRGEKERRLRQLSRQVHARLAEQLGTGASRS